MAGELALLKRMIWIVGAVFVAIIGPARAAKDDVFVVPRVPVQAQAESAVAAKLAAQAQGRRRAADILLRRLTIEEDWVYLPSLATGRLASGGPDVAKSAISLTDRDLEFLEAGFEVYDEKSAPTTYRAMITYRFKPDAVRRLLKNARLPYSETQTRPALIVPVLETANGAYLWEANNPWMAAWKSRPYVNELTPFRAPLGDLEDSGRLTARQALALDENAYAGLAAHYNVSQIVLAHARLVQSGGEDTLTVRLVHAFREAPLTPTDDLDAILAEPSASTPIESEADATAEISAAPYEDLSVKVGDLLAQATFSEPSGRFAMLAERAIEGAIARYAGRWKSRTLIDHSLEAVLETTAFYQSIDDWARIRAGLNATPLVGAVQVFSLSPRGAEMRLKVFGDPSRLIVALEAHDVAFWTEDNTRWFLATPGQAAQLRGDRSLRRRRGPFSDAGHAVDPNDPDAPQFEPASEYSDPELAPDSKIENYVRPNN